VSTSGVAQVTSHTQILNLNLFVFPNFIFPYLSPSHTMSSLFGSSPSAAPQTSEEIKAAVVRQLQTEAAMSNARSLIGVRHHPWLPTTIS
jgi:hypothetical protein